MAGVIDPIGAGLVTGLARPGGNITGLTQISPDLSGKRLELLKEVVPRLLRVALLWNTNHPGQSIVFKRHAGGGTSAKSDIGLVGGAKPGRD